MLIATPKEKSHRRHLRRQLESAAAAIECRGGLPEEKIWKANLSDLATFCRVWERYVWPKWQRLRKESYRQICFVTFFELAALEFRNHLSHTLIGSTNTRFV